MCESIQGDGSNSANALRGVVPVISRQQVVALVSAFDHQGDAGFEKSRELTLGVLEHSPSPFSRNQFTPGHVTCTAAVLSPDRQKVLLIFHQRLQRWLLPGGHVEEDDPEISAAAYREAREETNVVLDPRAPKQLVGIDVHGIPARKREPYHLHHDLIFASQAKSLVISCTKEARDMVWCSWSEFSRYAVPDSIRSSVKRSLTLSSTYNF